MPAKPTGHDSYFVQIDVVAVALGVTIKQARVIASRSKWRKSPGRPVGYLMADVRETARKRQQVKLGVPRGARLRHADTPPRRGNTEGA